MDHAVTQHVAGSHICALHPRTVCVLLFQASSGGGGGETQAAGPSGERAAICYAQPHHHYHRQSVSLPLSPLSPTACSLPDASAAYLPLSACQACLTHCTCWHKVGIV